MNQAIALLNVILCLVSLVLMVPILVFSIECFATLLPRRRLSWDTSIAQPKVAVLVPAHDEAAGIAATLATVLPQLTNQDRLFVIADNCTDSTSAIAHEAGAAVLERQDLERRGKGYALDFGLRHLMSNPPDVVVIVDADCSVAPGAIQQIAQLAVFWSRPVQATYLLSQPTKPRPKDAVSALAFTVKNLVRPLGLDRLALPCLLTGTGMAFPWPIVHKISWASGNIVEDMQLGLDLAIAGHAPMFCATARVTGQLPSQTSAAKSQRTRWEHGHLQTLTTQVPRLLKASIAQKRFDLLAIALDLCVPPLSLLVMLWVVSAGLGLLLSLLTGGLQAPTIVFALEGLLLLVAVFTAWVKFARADLPLGVLLAVPIYLLWKIPLYFAFLVKPQTKWVRTERDQ